MAEKTLYTALGHFRCRNDGGGRRYPVILMDHREFGMDPQEMTLWTALCWRLTDRQRAEDFYEQLSNGMELFPRRSFSDCLDRLVTRGLVAKGSGTTMADVNRLMKQFEDTRKMMKAVAGGNMKMPNMPGRRR